jgi:hypothetical protein
MNNTDLEKFDWSSGDASELREFLKTSTGTKVLRALALEEPLLLRSGETNGILIRSGEVAQHKYLTSFLLDLTGEFFEHHDDGNSVSNDYPSLTDDNAWDGPKLNEPQ